MALQWTDKINNVDVVDATDVNSLAIAILSNETAISDIEADYLTSANLQSATDTALAQAKASGEFDGADGYTPVRGTDYWTETDIAAIKSYVDDAIIGGAW